MSFINVMGNELSGHGGHPQNSYHAPQSPNNGHHHNNALYPPPMPPRPSSSNGYEQGYNGYSGSPPHQHHRSRSQQYQPPANVYSSEKGWPQQQQQQQYNGYPNDKKQRPQQQYPPPPGPPPAYYNQPSYQTYSARQQPRGPTFPSRFMLWKKTAGSGNTFYCVGTDMNNPVYSAKVPLATGKVVLRTGGHKPLGQEVCRAEETKRFSSSTSYFAIQFLDGTSFPVAKTGNMLDRRYLISMPINGRLEKFEWKETNGVGGIKGVLKGGGWDLTRQGDSNPLARLLMDSGNLLSLSSKSKIGDFQFMGPAATGEMGSQFALVALVSFLKIKQKRAEKEGAGDAVGEAAGAAIGM